MQVEIWSDVVCPWCYVGKRRFERALAEFEHASDVTVTYRSFELDVQAPAEREGSDDEHLARKYGMSLDQARQMHAQMTGTAAEEGLDFRFDRMRGGNTFDAHRLLHLARDRGVQVELKERLLHATFTDGEPVGTADALVRIATDAGLDEREVRDVLASDAYADAVRADEEQARAFGITGVPFFVVDRRYGVSGAQPSEVLLAMLEQAYAESRPVPFAPAAATAAPGCDDESCAV